MIILVLLCPLLFFSSLTAMQAHDEEILSSLQTQKRIPTFSIQPLKAGTLSDVIELSLPNPKFKLLAGKETFILIPSEPLEQQPVFDTTTLAHLYTYAIGLNKHEGTKVATEWPQWSQRVPASFLEQVESLLKEKYPTFEKQVKETFQNHVYAPLLDTSLVDRYITIIKAIFATYTTLPNRERLFVQAISHFLTQGAVIRNSSPIARWTSHAKETIIKTLDSHPDGKVILKELAHDNPILAAEIEVYTSSFII